MKVIILFILWSGDVMAKSPDKLDFFLEARVIGSGNVKTAAPNLNNTSTTVDMSGFYTGLPLGAGLNLGLEFLGNLPVSFFGAVQFNYQRIETANPDNSHVYVDPSQPVNHYEHKTRLTDNSLEAGLNINIRTSEIMVQPYVSIEVGTLKRFDRISFATTTGGVTNFLRENRSEYDLARVNLGVRLVSGQGYFSNFRFSKTDLSQTSQNNIFVVNGARTEDNQQYYDGSDFTEIYSFSIGFGSYF